MSVISRIRSYFQPDPAPQPKIRQINGTVIEQINYPHLDRIARVQPNPEILLGKDIVYTVKEDGSCAGIYLHPSDPENKPLQVRSRNLARADADMVAAFERCDCYENIRELLLDADTWNNEYVLFGELMRKGKSPTRCRTYEKDCFKAFDLYEHRKGAFVNYVRLYQNCYHFNVPVVDAVGTCNVHTMEHLYAFRDTMLEYCKDHSLEGVVGKIYDRNIPGRTGEGTGITKGTLYFKEKLDTPKLEKLPRLVTEGKVQLPDLPESEITGAVEKAYADLGRDFFNVKVAMPLVVKYIHEEARKHNCQAPGNMFDFYKRRVEDLKEVQE